MSLIYVVGSRVFPYLKTLYQLPDASSGANWSIDHGNTLNCVAADSDGNAYVAGKVSSSITTRKYNSAGTLQWSANHAAEVYAIAVDGSGNVATGGEAFDYFGLDLRMRYYNSAGVEQWFKSLSATVYAVAFDVSGNLYIGRGDGYVNKYNSAGTLLWSRNYHYGGIIRALAVDVSDNVYIAGNESGPVSKNTTRKYNSAGSLQWSKHHGGLALAIALDSSGNVYTSGTSVSGYAIKKYTNAGTEITTGWPAAHSNYFFGIAVSESDAVYAIGSADSGDGYRFRKYQSDGTEDWGQALELNIGFGVAVFEPPALTATPPGLALPLALAVPLPLFAFAPPGLALSLALAVPTASDPPVPPLGDGQRIYRAYLGLETPLLIPLHSLQCRRRQNESTWLAAQTTGSASLLTLLDSAIIAGQSLVIYAGLRDGAGMETLGEFLRAIVTDYTYTKTPFGYAVTIEARVQAVLETLQTRLMTGISRYQDEGGRRKIRCDVNPLLRPGDTVDTGSETFTANNITYFIGPHSAYLDVQEPPNG